MPKTSATKLRQLALSNQGLTVKQAFGAGLAGTLGAIEHLGYVQIDTLSVVERAHHHVLWSRVPGYDLKHLNQLVAAQEIFEYWYHAAAYLPIQDYRFALPMMHSIRTGEHRYFKQGDTRLMHEILACIKARGPLKLRDLDVSFKGKKVGQGTWWNMAPGKRAIEKLFMQGDLMVCAREGMEKIYDLTERCLPAGTDLSMPDISEYAAYLFDTTLRAHGVFTDKQLLHLKTGTAIREAMQAVTRQRIDEEVIFEVNDQASGSYYVDAQKIKATTLASHSNTLKILSPFDHVLIHRERLSSLFGFNYRMECYVPKAKRQFGYFSLPVLYGDLFAGRIDCKAHRNEARLEVLSIHLESDFTDDQFFNALKEELWRFTTFNQCQGLDDRVLRNLY